MPVEWTTTRNVPWWDAYVDHASQRGLALIEDVAELERGLLDYKCDTYCTPASGPEERKIDDTERGRLRSTFITGPHSNAFGRSAWTELHRLAGNAPGQVGTVASTTTGRALPEDTYGTSRYAHLLSGRFSTEAALRDALRTTPGDAKPPFALLQQELNERAHEIRNAGGPAERGKLVWHIFLDYARFFDAPQFRFSDMADLHRRALLQVFFAHPDAAYYGAQDSDGDRIGNAYERLHGLNPRKKEGPWDVGPAGWSTGMNLSGSFDQAAKRLDEYLRANGERPGAYKWERRAVSAFLLGEKKGNYKPSYSFNERSAISSTGLDYSLQLLREAGLDRELKVDAAPSIILGEVLRGAKGQLTVTWKAMSGWERVFSSGSDQELVGQSRPVTLKRTGDDNHLALFQDGSNDEIKPGRVVVSVVGSDGRALTPAISGDEWLGALKALGENADGARAKFDAAADPKGIDAMAKYLVSKGFTLKSGGAPVAVRLELAPSANDDDASIFEGRIHDARLWRMVPAVQDGADLAIMDAAGRAVASLNAQSVIASIRESEARVGRVFDTPLGGVDFLDGLNGFVSLAPHQGDRLVALEIDGAGQIVDAQRKLSPHATMSESGGAGAPKSFTLSFVDAEGKTVPAEKVGLFISRGGSIKGDAVIKGSKSVGWWGMCLEIKDLELATRKLKMPRPDRDVTLTLENGKSVTFTKDEIEQIWARRVIEMVSSSGGYTRVGSRFDAPFAALRLNSGETIRNVELAAPLSDRVDGVIRADGWVQLRGPDVLGHFQFVDLSGEKQLIDARQIVSIEKLTTGASIPAPTAADAGEDGGAMTPSAGPYTIRHWNADFSHLTSTQAKEVPGISFDGLSPTEKDGRRFLEWKNNADAPLRGKVVVKNQKGQEFAYDASNIAILTFATEHDVTLLQMLRYIDFHGGIFGGDGATGPSVGNTALEATDVATYAATDKDALPAWAKSVLERERLVGLDGEVKNEDKKNIVFIGIKQKEHDRFTGWVLLDQNRVPVNGDVVSGRFDFLEMNGTNLRFDAPAIYNPFVPSELALKLYVRSLQDPSKASQFLPSGWERLLDTPASPPANAPRG